MTKRNIPCATLAAIALAACQPPADETDINIDNNVNAAEAAGPDIEALPPSDAGGKVAIDGAAVPRNDTEDRN